VRNGDNHWIEVDEHGDYAVLKNDPTVTMAWGLTANDKYQEDWATKRHPSGRASSGWVDIFYHGALIFRTLYVVVDGGRAKLPQPVGPDDLRVPKAYANFIGIINELSGGTSDYLRYFTVSGFKLTDEPWPAL
jgi:hypothetical protein